MALARQIEGSLEHAVEAYLRRRANRDQRRPDRDYLDDLLVRSGDEPAPIERQCLTRRACRNRTEAVPSLYCRTFRYKNSDAQAEIEDEVAAMVARFDRWQRLEDAFEALQQPLRRLDRRTRISRDGEVALDLAQGEPVDDEEEEARVHTMTAFAAIADLYADTSELFQAEALRRGNDWESSHQSLNPVRIYGEADLVPTALTPEKESALRLDLLRARRLLASQTPVPADVPDRTVGAHLRESMLALHTSDFTGSLPRIALPDFVMKVISGRQERYRSADQIRRSIRRWDLFVFFMLALLTALTYTLSFYAGKDWGSWTDYVSAFVAGATVPSVVNWAVYPSLRTSATNKAQS